MGIGGNDVRISFDKQDWRTGKMSIAQGVILSINGGSHSLQLPGYVQPLVPQLYAAYRCYTSSHHRE